VVKVVAIHQHDCHLIDKILKEDWAINKAKAEETTKTTKTTKQ
jgi:hypothetical protein